MQVLSGHLEIKRYMKASQERISWQYRHEKKYIKMKIKVKKELT